MQLPHTHSRVEWLSIFAIFENGHIVVDFSQAGSVHAQQSFHFQKIKETLN